MATKKGDTPFWDWLNNIIPEDFDGEFMGGLIKIKAHHNKDPKKPRDGKKDNRIEMASPLVPVVIGGGVLAAGVAAAMLTYNVWRAK